MRTVLLIAPSIFVSLNSSAYTSLVNAFGPAVRNCDELLIVNGCTFATHGVGSRIGSPVAGLISGCQWPTAGFDTHGDGPKRPSSARDASIAPAAAFPAAIPFVFAAPLEIGASEVASAASSVCCIAVFVAAAIPARGSPTRLESTS